MVPLLSSLHLAACHVGDVGVRTIVRPVDHRKSVSFRDHLECGDQFYRRDLFPLAVTSQ
ncbi:Uncharacterised protein [Vibrio cholerae]|nr:Uncharacterised protein [Vibrio cholerae]